MASITIFLSISQKELKIEKVLHILWKTLLRGLLGAQVAKWQTHYLEVVAPQGMQVRLLSWAQKLTCSEF